MNRYPIELTNRTTLKSSLRKISIPVDLYLRQCGFVSTDSTDKKQSISTIPVTSFWISYQFSWISHCTSRQNQSIVWNCFNICQGFNFYRKINGFGGYSPSPCVFCFEITILPLALTRSMKAVFFYQNHCFGTIKGEFIICAFTTCLRFPPKIPCFKPKNL